MERPDAARLRRRQPADHPGAAAGKRDADAVTISRPRSALAYLFLRIAVPTAAQDGYRRMTTHDQDDPDPKPRPITPEERLAAVRNKPGVVVHHRTVETN